MAEYSFQRTRDAGRVKSIVVNLTLPVGLLLGRFELPNQPDAEG
jgi:hypothetical protein